MYISGHGGGHGVYHLVQAIRIIVNQILHNNTVVQAVCGMKVLLMGVILKIDIYGIMG